MNETLKFSWGHIIAFLALILVSYISFMGLTYLTNGNFVFAIIGMIILDLVYLGVFIGAQFLKSSGVKMNRKIVMERILIFASPAVFVVGMIFMSHFFTVNSQEKEVKQIFSTSIANTRQLFADYENYSQKRIASYDSLLSQVAANPKNAAFKKAGFVEGKGNIQKENMMETLRLQLSSPNYNEVKESALKWIDEAENGATTWNVFILGNTKEIKETIKGWEEQLRTFSSKKMSNEEMSGSVAEFSSPGAQAALAGLDQLTDKFTSQKFPTVLAIIFGIITYLMLILPYLLQRRHTKSMYRNLLSKKDHNTGFNIPTDDTGSQAVASQKSASPGKGTFRL